MITFNMNHMIEPNENGENQWKGGMRWSFNGLLLLYTPFMQVQIFGNVHFA